jgi:predicted permease
MSLWQDVRYGARVLRLSPGFFAVATLSLALGIGANTAIFELLNAVRLRTLPIAHPEQLAEIKIVDNDHCCNGNFTGRRSRLTYAQWQQIRANQQAFSSIFAWGQILFNLAESGEVRYAEGLWVSGQFFETLGVRPELGRLIGEEDDRPGCGSPGAVIGYSFWQREFGGDRGVLGRRLTLDGHPVEIIGVTPAAFFGVEVGHNFEVAVPVCSEAWFHAPEDHTSRRNHWWLAAIGRLKPGWTVERASAQANAMSAAVFESTVPPDYRPETAKYYRGYKLKAEQAGNGVSDLRSDYQQPLLLLLGIAGLVLLIACANLANLALARASTREREMAIRLAIGAGRGRLIRQLLVECLLLTMAGTAFGVALAQWLSSGLVSFLTTGSNRLFLEIQPDWRVLGFTAAVAVLTCILFGLTPALRATRAAPSSAMKSSGRGTTAGREGFSLRRVLVVTQVALSLVLLVGALLFAGTLQKLMSVDAGLKQDGVVIAQINVDRLKYSPERLTIYFRDMLAAVRATPGIEQAAVADVVPLAGDYWNDNVEIPDGKNRPAKTAWFNRVSPGYFRAMETQMIAGRDFNDRDTVSSTPVAIVNQEFVKYFFGGANALGQQFRVQVGVGQPEQVYQIAGVVKNSKYVNLREKDRLLAYVAHSQEKKPGPRTNLVVRSSLPLGTLLSRLKSTIHDQNAGTSVEFQVYKTAITDSLLRERLMATLSEFFGGLAGILATVGLYGLISYMVAKRRNEIGIRIALGANRGNVIGLVLREAVLLVGIGVAIGAAAAVAAARTASSLLYGFKPGDPWVIGSAAAMLGAIGLIASFLPSLRASRVEPMAALREE